MSVENWKANAPCGVVENGKRAAPAFKTVERAEYWAAGERAEAAWAARAAVGERATPAWAVDALFALADKQLDAQTGRGWREIQHAFHEVADVWGKKAAVDWYHKVVNA